MRLFITGQRNVAYLAIRIWKYLLFDVWLCIFPPQDKHFVKFFTTGPEVFFSVFFLTLPLLKVKLIFVPTTIAPAGCANGRSSYDFDTPADHLGWGSDDLRWSVVSECIKKSWKRKYRILWDFSITTTHLLYIESFDFLQSNYIHSLPSFNSSHVWIFCIICELQHVRHFYSWIHFVKGF